MHEAKSRKEVVKMIALNGYFDGNHIVPLGHVPAFKKDQKVIITILDEIINENSENQSTDGHSIHLRGKYRGVLSTEKFWAQKQADKELVGWHSRKDKDS